MHLPSAAPDPGLVDDLDFLLEILMLPEHESLQWTADRQEGPQPVRGGWTEVCKLVSSLDGASWPWLVVDDLDSGLSFQVLGSADAMVLEVAARSSFSAVARTGGRGPMMLMPQECRWWVEVFWSSEAFAAAEATAIGIEWLRTGSLREDLELRAPHETPGTRRPRM